MAGPALHCFAGKQTRTRTLYYYICVTDKPEFRDPFHETSSSPWLYLLVVSAAPVSLQKRANKVLSVRQGVAYK